MIELLSPVGDFDCLKAAVQNGANCVYLGAKSFGARAFANNFDDSNLEKAINYAKLRNVKTNLTLNTLIKESEFDEAFSLAEKAYKFGIDAIIVQDFGLALELIKYFPNLDIHASTQMTVHNLEGALHLQKLGFKRIVLSRELSLDEIKYICDNTDIEIEVFIHGALCISYSGQCLFSSMVGGRSGNRGKCAQPCRLPYELLESKTSNHFDSIDTGYLLSPRDLCSLDLLPSLINSGVDSLKIEGRMKSPEYVAEVTKTYRKYIDLALNDPKEFKVDPIDKKRLLQVFNRGGFSTGHLLQESNHSLIFKEKQNHMGLYLGTVSNFNKNKGLVTCNLKEKLSIGDSISFENENTKYTVSELMENKTNIKNANLDQLVTFGRMKGNINLNDKIYKLTDKLLSDETIQSIKNENIKVPLSCKLNIKKDTNILVSVASSKFNVSFDYNYIPLASQNSPLTKEKIINQFCKTLNTPFVFENFDIELDDNLFIAVSILNDIRRTGLEKIEQKIINSFKPTQNINNKPDFSINPTLNAHHILPAKICLLLNILNLDFDYTLLSRVDKLYIPLKYFNDLNYENILKCFSNNFNLYIYMPTIIRKNYTSTAKNTLNKAFDKFKIKGIVISNISQLDLINDIYNKTNSIDLIGNYTLNTYNSHSFSGFQKENIKTITISPELDKDAIITACNNTSISKELIVYGKLPLMTINYCPLGKSNKCYSTCLKKCKSDTKFYLKDRLGVYFRVIPDNLQTISTIYNSKTLSIDYNDFNIDFSRIDILDENIEKINNIINIVKNKKRFERKRLY